MMNAHRRRFAAAGLAVLLVVAGTASVAALTGGSPSHVVRVTTRSAASDQSPTATTVTTITTTPDAPTPDAPTTDAPTTDAPAPAHTTDPSILPDSVPPTRMSDLAVRVDVDPTTVHPDDRVTVRLLVINTTDHTVSFRLPSDLWLEYTFTGALNGTGRVRIGLLAMLVPRLTIPAHGSVSPLPFTTDFTTSAKSALQLLSPDSTPVWQGPSTMTISVVEDSDPAVRLSAPPVRLTLLPDPDAAPVTGPPPPPPEPTTTIPSTTIPTTTFPSTTIPPPGNGG